jgi:hypothetical protein
VHRSGAFRAADAPGSSPGCHGNDATQPHDGAGRSFRTACRAASRPRSSESGGSAIAPRRARSNSSSASPWRSRTALLRTRTLPADGRRTQIVSAKRRTRRATRELALTATSSPERVRSAGCRSAGQLARRSDRRNGEGSRAGRRAVVTSVGGACSSCRCRSAACRRRWYRSCRAQWPRRWRRDTRRCRP